MTPLAVKIMIDNRVKELDALIKSSDEKHHYALMAAQFELLRLGQKIIQFEQANEADQ